MDDTRYIRPLITNMNILCLFDHYYPYIGGAEVVNKKITEYLNKKQNITIVTKKIKGVKTGIEVLNGVKIYRTLNVPRLLHSVVAYALAQKFADNADIIISATYASGLAGYWLSRTFKKKSILLVHEILNEHWQYFKPYNHFLYQWYERYIVTRPFDCYIAFSFYTKRRLMEYGIPESRIKVIYHGVDSSLFYPRPVDAALRNSLAGDAPFVYLYFGRPGGSKGLPYLIKAVPEITNAIPGSRLILILSRETKAEYRTIMRLIEETNRKTDTITVIDSVPLINLPDYINIADTVVIPSLSEGFGFSAAESCMLGKKVVITDTGSLPEVAFGRVVKVQKADSHALARGVIRMFNNDFEVVAQKTFTWEKALQQYDTVLQELFN
jgi:glycosyltransferase involved in cell wall biosynthesis